MVNKAIKLQSKARNLRSECSILRSKKTVEVSKGP